MSASTSINLQPLHKKHRNKLEATVKKAREVAEEAARAVVEQLEVGAAKVQSLELDEEKDLRRRLRIHGRQLGDERDPKEKTQQVDRLVEEIAYEHWHRMLFARFLAENDLLMYPDPDDPVAVSIEDCNELAEDEGAKNGWELAARFAAKMLPQIFRVDSPVFALTLPPEKQQQLERLLAELPGEVFSASDSLGWGYQYWQAKRNKEVNDSEEKVGALELPAATQFFTEPYMVNFLLDNSLGAWWAARRLTETDFRTATSEQNLREKAALPGVPLSYLRFVWVDPAVDAQSATGGDARLPFEQDSRTRSAEDVASWRLAGGTFDGWPESLAEFKALDPCCGSGHFLVATLLMLVPMRMELEGVSANEAIDRVLTENLHGLEIDRRCVELAAFALALASWQFPNAGGYRELPEFNVACCGLSMSISKSDWTALGKDNDQLRIALDWMYDELADSPLLGSLLNPAKGMASTVLPWDQLLPIIHDVLSDSDREERREAAVVAHGLARACALLTGTYSIVMTNVPYLGRGKQHERIAEFCEEVAPDAKADLSTVFCSRALELTCEGGTVALVSPQSWLYLSSYKQMRKRLLGDFEWNFAVLLGKNAFQDMNWWAATTSLIGISNEPPRAASAFTGIDAGGADTPSRKSAFLRDADDGGGSIGRKAFKGQSVTGPCRLLQQQQIDNPDHRVVIADVSDDQNPMLSEYAESLVGIQTGDDPRFVADYWEVDLEGDTWEFLQSTPEELVPFAGCETVIRWSEGNGALHSSPGAYLKGLKAVGRPGICVHRMGGLYSYHFSKAYFHQNVAVISPKDPSLLSGLWAFCSSEDYYGAVREIDQSLKVTNGTLAKVRVDIARWQRQAQVECPLGLPNPYSDDPTQWLFHGHPASSSDALQVAVARLLGYRWPVERDPEIELASDARDWIEQGNQLSDFSDTDGIVCIPPVGSEQPAEDRLLNLLNRAYELGREQELDFSQKLEAGDENDPVTVDLWRRAWKPSLPDSFGAWRDNLLEAAEHTGKTLESWLRDKFFAQHCKLFHHRPFIWHIWDGLKDGFSALINYHKLDNKLLKTLIYTHLNNWITRQKKDQAAGVDGSEEKLVAAEWLKQRLELILHGESPHDIFVRWKPLEEQPIGWNPDLNDGVRLNIRPWMTVGDVKKKGAGLFRDKPNIHWKKDRGKDVESAPWFDLGPEYGGKEGDRINDHHLTLAEKEAAQSE